MLSYSLKCIKNTENINPTILRSSNDKKMILSNCAICGSQRLKFIKTQEANGLLSSLGIKTLLSKIHLLGNVLFSIQFH